MKEANGPDAPNLPSKATFCDPCLENQIQHLESENSILKTQIIDLEAIKETFKETAYLLEEKLFKAEASALKSFNAQRQEVLFKKKSLTAFNQEIDNLKKDSNQKNKLVKEKEKEVYRLDQKSDNLESNLKKINLT